MQDLSGKRDNKRKTKEHVVEIINWWCGSIEAYLFNINVMS